MPSSAGMEAADGAGAVVALGAADAGFARAWLGSAVVVAGGGVTGVAGANESGDGDASVRLGCTFTTGGPALGAGGVAASLDWTVPAGGTAVGEDDAGDVAAGLGCTVTAGGVAGSVAGGEGSADGVRVCGADDASGGPFGADCGFSAMIP